MNSEEWECGHGCLALICVSVNTIVQSIFDQIVLFWNAPLLTYTTKPELSGFAPAVLPKEGPERSLLVAEAHRGRAKIVRVSTFTLPVLA
jgi:hypothetical protein